MELTGQFTDHYELTMLTAALRDGTADRQCVFEVFARKLPAGRRYGVVAGTGRLVEAVQRFGFDAEQLAHLREWGVLDDRSHDFLADFRFTGDILGYPEGELYFPGSPVLTVRGRFAEAVILETLALSVLNHDTAVASAAARMVSAAGERPIIEMGSRRTHEESAVAAARAAYLAGFSSTSNLAAGLRYGIPTSGTAAHAYTMVHDSEAAAFRSQAEAFGPGTTLLVDTYDITQGVASAVAEAGTRLGAIRIDSGDLGVLASHARELLDSLGATNTRIVLSGDLNEFSIATLAVAPVDAYGAGTSVVTGSGAPTAGMVYKLVEVDGRPVAKRSEHKISLGGEKVAVRRHKPTGTATEEVVSAVGRPESMPGDRELRVPFLLAGERVDRPTLEESREHLRRAMVTLPWDGLKLSEGEAAIPTRFVPEH